MSGFVQKSGFDPNCATEKWVEYYFSKSAKQPAKFYTNQTYSSSTDAGQPAKF